MNSVLRIPTILVIVCALVAGLPGPRVFASTRIVADASTDRDALVALYEATGGDSWINNDNWLSDNPISEWYGVTLDDEGRVSELLLYENQLRGHIPPELGNLSNLTVLNLYSNQLNGTIPSDLGNLSDLEVLALSANQLNGSIPPEIGSLSDLQVLALWENKLRGSIPPGLSKLSSLEVLDLSSNQLSGTIPSELSELSGLEWLALSANRLHGSIPPVLGNLINLEWLDLSSNQLNGTIPPELGHLARLTGLHLYDNGLNGTIPPELGRLIKLKELSIWGNWLTTSIPSELGNLINLELLYLSDNSMLIGCVPEVWRSVEESDLEDIGLPFCTDTDALVALYQATEGAYWQKNLNWLSDAPIGTWYGVTTDDNGRVIELDLSENGLSGTIPPELGNLTKLQWLDLYSNQLRGSIPSELGKLTNLELLSLGDNRLSGGIPPELGNITKLTQLALWVNQLSGSIPSELGRLTNLELLSLSHNQLSGSIPSELGKLSKLEWLALSYNELSGAVPLELGKLTKLRGLALSGNNLSRTIPPELGHLLDLEMLALADNKLSGAIPSELGNLTKLEFLHLSGNRLSGCVPEAWRNVEESDLSELELPFCTALSLTATGAPEALTGRQIFAKVSPAIVFIQTEISSGSGVLIDGGYVVTNAHVVWPFDAARVVFPDGTEFGQVPVKGWDLLADLAVLGPIDASAQPATLLDGESIPIGSDMYLIGYPGEYDLFPQPVIVPGILSGLRQWEPAGVTYFQTPAPTAGGQSGGALVSSTGYVIGISGFTIIEGKFVLSASSADLLPRIQQLIGGEDSAGHSERLLPLEGGVRRHELTLQNYGDAYILNEPVGTSIEVELSGADEGGFRVFDSLGYEVTEDETDSFSFETEYNGPHFLVVSESGSGRFTLISNRPLTRFDDPDDSRRIQVGQSLNGNIDFPGDIDFFSLPLKRNETVEIVAQSVLADTFLSIWDPIAEEWASDDDSGGGLFGEDARVIFQAPQTGEYDLFVADAAWSAPGGYVISVKRAEETDVLTPLDSSGTPTRPVPVVSIHNPLVIPIGDTPAVSAEDIYEWFPAGYEPPTGPTVTINGTMNVRGGPGTNYSIIGAATAGQQYAALSRNAAGDWWQIEYEGQLAWVYGGLVTPSADAANAPQAGPSGWLTYDEEARGLSLSYPPGWRYFDPAQPTQADLALFSAARRGDEEQLDIAEMGAMVSAMSVGSEDAVIGLGLQSDQAGDSSSNFMLVFSFAADGLSLERYVQVVADRLQDSYGVEAASVELAPELRPLGEEAVSIRYRESETNSEVWQVWLLSPDEETLLAIAFSVHSDEFSALEPLLREIVQKAQWANQPTPTFPVVTIGGQMNVRGGPGTFYPVLGTASAGEQFAITGKNSSGAWWRVSYNEQPGWVFSQLVTASGPLEDVPLVKAFDWDGFHDSERRLWIVYPPGWFFFDPLQTSEADRKSLGDLIGQEYAEQWLRDFAADMDTGQKERYVGFGFKFSSESTVQFEVSAFPADGLDLGRVMSIVQEGFRESGLDVDSAEMVTNLRYDGAETVSIRYRDNRAGLGSEKIYWQVWTASPDRGTFLRISFIFHSSESAQLVPLFSELVRRIRWE